MKFWKRLVCWLVCLFCFLTTLTPAFAMDIKTGGEYRLSKYDVLNVVIIGFSEKILNDIIIGPDGYVNLPYAGSVKIAGLTIPEATAVLSEKLSEYIKIPSMSIMVTQYGPRKVYVMGEVNKPGIYSLGSDYMNVFAAISSAGGIAKKGRTRNIAVVRVEDGVVKKQTLDIERFIKKQDITQNIALIDGDMVYVPKSNKISLTDDIMPLLSMYGIYESITD